jgi:hypothetical protein
MGLAGLPYAQMPEPFVNQEAAFIHSMVDAGFDQVVAGLTGGLDSGVEHAAWQELLTEGPWLTFEAPEVLDALDAMNAAFLRTQSGDGLPLQAATRERVERMLAGTTRDRDEVVGLFEPGDGLASIEKIAINAVMAGCSPGHLPLVIAAVECMVDPQMGLRRKVISTGPNAPMVIVNGPARHRAGLNHGPCMLGPGARSHANIVIGRALRLCLTNIGHTFAAVSEMDTIGTPGKFSMCVAENEENSPWNPMHVDLGFDPAASTVTINYLYGLSDLQDFKSTAPETAVKKFATGTKYLGVNSAGHWLTGHREDPRYGNVEQEHHLILMAPEHTKIFTRAGWTKRDISEAIFREARHPFGFLAARLEESAIRIGRPELSWLWDSPDNLVPILEDPGCYDIVVAGSVGSNRSSYAWGMGGPVTKVVTQADLELDLPS